jgi:hypothetical protein
MLLRNTTNRWSLTVLLCLSIWLVFFRATHISNDEISWDVFGYYLPLEATFIEGDMWLNDRAWVEELNAKHQVSGTLYQISSTPDNQPMYFFFLGMSMMYSVFFFIGHFSASLFGFPQDGLSDPYVYALVFGCLFYAIVGLHYLRKILLHFFPDKLTAALLFICVIGTNYVNHMTIKNLETVNVLFMFSAIIIWNTIRWYSDHKLKNMLAIGVSIVLMALIKPSEVLIVLLPVLWGIFTPRDGWNRVKELWNYKYQILLTVVVCAIIACPQVIYWYVKTGSFFYDSYKNPGVGLDYKNPHVYESLFGYRKGWLVYTPIMIFALLGFIVVFRKNRSIFWGLFIPFMVSFYVIISWTEYWYGAGFSNRPVISLYPILLIPMGYFIQWIWTKNQYIRLSFATVVVFFIFLNQFQWWQFRNYILDATRMTKEYYWAIFLKTGADEKTRELLLINRSYNADEVHVLKNVDDYQSRSLLFNDVMESRTENNENIEFIHTVSVPYKKLTKQDHCYVRFQFDYLLPDSVKQDAFFAVMMNRENGDYENKYFRLENVSDNWKQFDTLFLTPEVRSVDDLLKCFIWNPNKQTVEAKNLRISVLEKKK